VVEMAGPAAAAPAPVDDDASMVVVVLETGARFWAAGPAAGEAPGSVRSAGFSRFLSDASSLLAALWLLNPRNRVTVVAMHDDGAHVLLDHSAHDHDVPAREALGSAVAQLPLCGGGGGGGAPPLSAALSTALCLLRRDHEDAETRISQRVLCLLGSPDPPRQYVAVMNAIFSAQRLGACIDACAIGAQDSAMLQQAAHLTGGLYLRPPRPEGLLQYLLSVFAVDVASRASLRTAPPPSVDFRASCFCHKRPIDTGYVCSVCLSIFCEERATCGTCGSELAGGGRLLTAAGAAGGENGGQG